MKQETELKDIDNLAIVAGDSNSSLKVFNGASRQTISKTIEENHCEAACLT